MQDVFEILVIGLQTGAIYSFVALGVALVYRATGVLNFAQGELGTAPAFAAYLVLVGGDVGGTVQASGMRLAVATSVAVLTGAVLGALVYLLVIRRLGAVSAVTALVATAGVALLFSAVQVIVFEARGRRFPRFVSGGDLSVAGVVVTWHTVVILVALLTVAGVLAAFFRSPWGTALLATAQDPFAAELYGVPVGAMRTLAWAAAGALGAVAGVLGAGVFNLLTPGLMTTTFLIPAFTGAVLGGITSMRGAALGGLLLGVVVAGANQLVRTFELSLPGAPQTAVLVALLLVLLVRPQGLLGKAA